MTQDQKRFRLNLLLMKINRGYEAFGYQSFKDYVINKLSITYDAAIKHMMAANTAIKLFGPDYVGYYSDSAMITLGAVNFELQVKAIIELKKKLGKDMQDSLLRSELTKKSVDETFKNMSRNIVKVLDKALPDDCRDENYCEIDFELHPDIFEIADEEEFKSKYGFSRWDERSLKLTKADQLASLPKADLKRELETEWSLKEMLKHVQTFHPDMLDDAIDFAMNGHNYLTHFMLDIYGGSDVAGDDVNSSEDDIDDDDYELNEHDLDELEINYPGPKSVKENEQYINERRKLIGKLQSLTDKSDVVEHPKLAVMKAFFELLNHEDLTYIHTKSKILLNQEDEEEDEFFDDNQLEEDDELTDVNENVE
ncbi:hypothetical protein RNAN_3562 [Rheinheimera nanhaiensis E407-8]|uniref:Uncharacterized protein n=2 Tax=Rheinheimera TaxID=67575 RepID=I1E2K9_9GAMM|nr:hypothetical protein RNAN_3562 [Rheinheimera nanhaiensis E407-8]